MVLEDAGLRRPRRAGGRTARGPARSWGPRDPQLQPHEWGVCRRAWTRWKRQKRSGAASDRKWTQKSLFRQLAADFSVRHVRFADRPDLWLGGPGFARRLGQPDLWAKTRPRGRTTGCRPTSSTSTSTTLGVQQAALSLPVPCSRSSAAHLSGPPALGELLVLLLGIVLVQEHGVFLVLHVRPRGLHRAGARSSSPHAGPRRWPSPISGFGWFYPRPSGGHSDRRGP